MGNPFKKLSRIIARAEDNVKGVGSAINDAASPENILAYFASPHIAQNISASRAMSGADARTALAAPGQAASDPIGYTSENWQNLAAFNAALLLGAAGGMVGGAAAMPFSAGTSVGFGTTGAAVGAGAAGTAAYAGLLNTARSGASNTEQTGEAPPDVNEANDPAMAAQFKRLRKASRSLGRAGTFKNKGAGTSLGLGDSVLGDQLSLIGS